MDFPSSLRPSLFMAGPLGMTDGPDLSFMCSWRDALTLPGSQPQNCKDGTLPLAKNLLWEPTTPGPLPLLPPGHEPWEPGMTPRDLLFRGGHRNQFRPQVGLDVTEQLSHFLWDHGDIAFAPLGKLMLENFRLEGNKGYSKKMTIVSAKRLLQDLGGHQPWGCPWAFLSHRLRRFSILGGPVLSRSVSVLMGRLLHEELAFRWEQLLLDEAFTGGALAWLPGRTARAGQLVYPSGGALDKLYFQEVSVNSGGNPRVLEDPGHIQLRGPVRQVVTSTVQGETFLAVRSDYHCAMWKTDKQGPPAPLQVLQVEKGATGVSLSPHLPGEMAICSRSGAVCLWTPQDGLQLIYKDPETLAFRDPSPWRWTDFTAHPRVLTVGDRTGVKMVDIQGPPGCGLLLFRAGAEAACQKGERVLLAQYLGQPGPTCTPLHLICTQFSIYLMDERLPLVPMLKWDHGLPSAPLLARLLPPASPGYPRPLLLGGQGGQLQLLHITGEGTSVPQLAGPPQSLPSIIDSLSAFPPLEPKRQQQLQERLEAPVIGLAAAPPCALAPALLLFQLSAAGDIFYQHLRLQPASSLGEGEPRGHHSAPEGPASKAVTPVDQSSWTPQATVRCSRWMEALMELAPPCPVWAARTFSHRRFLSHMEQQKSQTMSQKLRAAMAKGKLLRPEDLGTLPRAEPPPAPQCGQQDELTERLAEAWEGGVASWWKRHQSQTSGSQTQTKRPKRRTQLASTFSSLTSYLDFPDTSSPPRSQDHSTSEAWPRPPGTPPSQELTQELWAQGVQRERRQTLRDFMAKLPLKDTPGPVATPPSQASSLRSMAFKQQAPVLSGSHPPRKKPRMGF
ncbi:TATA box-binding protein-associated factor RNA polymerase I subunit C isoform X1 [Peromyscus maniculatus bairdii]|uniref:TATA box-binding protein-associated factor RNA polymerase I subunit C isoform X1 n=2 Tax=Peromyscus maniculatus bairdii TaxID=230844 RepID=UPI00042AE2C8|nr:TATA box-binding protein-associated factor RNA polymerase I subunit C isoform X1 [Peromyscus maniculatus bairdii]XP_015863926.1 TATA box-binding protein-associated factor RNA polymerase I subunit C isoform X1 [Peromyscus maniculatus bairdii]